ncbi:UNVERIFIED_CONTAM: hypothetical protein PYX00_011875 [Menopon gallinae]|uniref:DNA repair protein RAD52 homolog n=1 Tax=Menopon gallinae TaxID=328185 RepID=A0AAW2H8M8_9NEOP
MIECRTREASKNYLSSYLLSTRLAMLDIPFVPPGRNATTKAKKVPIWSRESATLSAYLRTKRLVYRFSIVQSVNASVYFRFFAESVFLMYVLNPSKKPNMQKKRGQGKGARPCSLGHFQVQRTAGIGLCIVSGGGMVRCKDFVCTVMPKHQISGQTKSILAMYCEDRSRTSRKCRKTGASLERLLSKNLGPEYLSYRPGWNGERIAYIEGWTAISLANKIFGHDGWSSEIRGTTVDFYDDVPNKICLGVSVVMRITLKNGTFKEDIGFGSSENQKSKGTAWEKAKKEAVTDGLKRALRQFGNALGNCCYDKEFLKNIRKITKERPVDIDKDNLVRKSDFSRNMERSIEALSMDDNDIDLTDSCGA